MFGRKARRINELQAKLTGKEIDLRAALKARAEAEAKYTASREQEEQVVAHLVTATARNVSLSAERDQLSAKVEELEQKLAEADSDAALAKEELTERRKDVILMEAHNAIVAGKEERIQKLEYQLESKYPNLLEPKSYNHNDPEQR